MANEEHLEILKRGVEAWNTWRYEHRDVIPKLSGADLRGADLIAAHLSGVDLSGANLNGANLLDADLTGANLLDADLGEAWLAGANLNGAHLSEADLTGANLNVAHLSEADLTGANLNYADLRGADLRGADLRGAHLIVAHLSGVDLTGANLNGARASEASFDNIDLSQAKGLDKVVHYNPSTIGIDTIYKSKGNIPEAFLRGCGVPENFITFMHSLAAQEKAFEFYSCFISYSSKDQDFAERLHADLQSKAVRVWFAPEDLKIGDKFRTRIDEAIRIYDKLMVVLSENSIDSTWVEKEVETAFEKERARKSTVLFPIRLDDAVMGTNQAWAADIRRTRHIGDFKNWKIHDDYQKAFTRLLRDLTAESEKSSA